MGTVRASQAGMILFGQVGRFFEWDLCLPIGALIGVLALGLWAILQAKRWHDDAVRNRDVVPADELVAQWEKMAEEGQVEPEELARIKARLEAGFDPQPPDADISQPPDKLSHEK